MAMSLKDFIAEHPVDRDCVEMYKERMLAEIHAYRQRELREQAGLTQTATTLPLLGEHDDVLKRFARILDSAPEIPANLRITGPRGVGKSVLLRQMEERARESGWATYLCRAEPRHNRDEAMRQLITRMSEAAISQMSRANHEWRMSDTTGAESQIATLSNKDVAFGLIGSDSCGTEVSKFLFDTVDHALSNGYRGFLLVIDNAHVVRDDRAATGQHPLSMLVTAANTLQEAGLPFALILCGLPSLRSNLQRARSYAERMFHGEEIGALSENPRPEVA